MDIFFGKMGITDLKYKPAYNPCTLLVYAETPESINHLLEVFDVNILVP